MHKESAAHQNGKTACLVVMCLLLFVGALACSLFVFVWTGDTEIHLIFAQNLIAGHPLQFNCGEYSSGETAPLYMLLVVGLSMVLSPLITAWVIKGVGVLSACWIARELYRAGRNAGQPRGVAGILPAVWISFPFVWYQAWQGMENMLFAACVVTIIRAWLEGRFPGECSIKILAWGLLISALFFIRPEAVFLIAALGFASLIQKDIRRAILWGLPILYILLLDHIIQAATGVPLHGAGGARVAMDRIEAFVLPLPFVEVFIHQKPLRSLIYLWPLIGWGCWALAGGFKGAESNRTAYRLRATAVWLMLVLAPWGLHLLCVLPNTHISRYLLYVNACFLLLMVPALTHVVHQRRLGAFVLMTGVGVLAANGLELIHRFRSPQTTFWIANPSMAREKANTLAWRVAPETVREVSDGLCREFGCPDDRPLVLALKEVQLRLRLDERFVVRSLDGIVDHRMAPHVHDWGIDYLAYIKERQIEYLLDFPHHVGDPEKFSLRALKDLSPGDRREVEDLVFTALYSETLQRNVVRVEQVP